jgi:hypothetical protein
MGTERPKKPLKDARRAKNRATAEMVIEQRRAKVVKLRVAGWSIRDIAAHLNVSVGLVHGDLSEVLVRTREQANESVKVERELSIERLETAIKKIWDQVEGGDLDAVDRLVRLEQRLAKLQGLDAPTKQELSGPDGAPIEVTTKTTLERKLDELGKRLTGGTAQPGGAPSM